MSRPFSLVGVTALVIDGSIVDFAPKDSVDPTRVCDDQRNEDCRNDQHDEKRQMA